MTIRKTKSGKWTVDVSNGFHPVTQKRIRIIRKGLLVNQGEDYLVVKERLGHACIGTSQNTK